MTSKSCYRFLRDDVPSLRILLNSTSARLVQFFEVERCANTCTAGRGCGPALGCRRACPATRDAGERPRCNTPQPPLCMFRRRMFALQPVVSLDSSPPIPAADDETSEGSSEPIQQWLTRRQGNIKAERQICSPRQSPPIIVLASDEHLAISRSCALCRGRIMHCNSSSSSCGSYSL